jgi:hypothetical protein
MLSGAGIATHEYATSFLQQLWIVLQRQRTLMIRSKSTTIGRLSQCIIMGLFTGMDVHAAPCLPGLKP